MVNIIDVGLYLSTAGALLPNVERDGVDTLDGAKMGNGICHP